MLIMMVPKLALEKKKDERRSTLVYSYDTKKRKVKAEKTPQVFGEDAKRMKRAKVPVDLFEKVSGMRFNIVKD